jgi:2-methylisocitrate lyase-like PEP mutase family enzyme
MAAGGEFDAFAALHVRGAPLILFNAWDAGSARAIAGAGAKAIATGSWAVAAAHGLPDGEALPIDAALANAAEIVAAVELPVSIDFEGGYAVDPEQVGANMARLAATGAIGCNFEDRVVDGDGLHSIETQHARIRAARDAVGPDFFINARTDIFLSTPTETHDDAKAKAAIARGLAYAEAGASGFFVPGLVDLALLARICEAVPLPVNAMAFPGAPSAAAFTEAGVARISHGPGAYRLAMQAVDAAARAALG